MVGSVWKNTHVGQCIIRKQTDTDEDLEGWTITIYSDPECTQVIDTLTTAADGSALCYLEPGIYYAKETGDLYGRFEDSSWSIDTEVKEFTIVEGQDTEITFRNSRRSGTISIQKVDIYGEPLAGAKFLLEWSEDGIVWTEIARSDSEGTVKGESADEGTQISPEDGIIQWRNLHPGVLYRITELNAPEGFLLLDAPAFEGTLPESNLTVTLCVVNARTFTLPETGSRSAALLPLSAALCLALCAGALLWLRKKEG
jgi:LPXTG-motif cell wall-anchored protein